jgi:hypothetical protein
MSTWGTQDAWHGGDVEDDGITVSRQLSLEEAVQRLQVARQTVLMPVLGYVLGGGLIVLLLAVGLMTQWSFGWMLVTALVFAVVVGGAVTLGLVLGNGVLRRQAGYELGRSGILTVTWGATGGRVAAENMQRSFGYQEIQWIRHVAGLVVLKLPMTWHASQYVMVLPEDFVPAGVRQRIVATGVPIR